MQHSSGLQCNPKPSRHGLSTGTRALRCSFPVLLIYNAPVLAFARACMTVMTWIFLVGITGSLLVIVISFIEDLTQISGKE